MKITPCGKVHPEFKYEKKASKKDAPVYVPKMKWNVNYEPEGVFDIGDIYTLEINGKIAARFSNNGGWGRGIKTLINGKLQYDHSISGHLSLEDTQKAIEEKFTENEAS